MALCSTLVCPSPGKLCKRELMENGLPKQSGWTSFVQGGKAFFGLKGDLATLPSQDQFYGYHSTISDLQKGNTTPGTLLRKRGIYITEFPGFDANEQIGWQMAFMTRGQDPIKDIQVTVATIIIPPNAGKRDKIIFQFPKSDSANPDSRTSYTLNRQSGSFLGAASEQVFMIDYLQRGWIVVCVDYEGQFDAFGAGPTAGHTALDSIRATLQFTELRLAPKQDLKVIGWGYSGGAIAVSFAAQLLQSYAPELSPIIKGWSTGGVPTDLRQCAYHVNSHLAAGLIIGIMQGLSNIYPNLTEWLNTNMNEKGKNALFVAKTKGFYSFMSENAFKDILYRTMNQQGTQQEGGYFTIKGDPLTTMPKSILQTNTVGNDFKQTNDKKFIPNIPMFIYQSIPDEVVPIQIVDDLVNLWTSNGAIIDYTRVQVWQHVGTIFAMQPKNVQWISDRFDGISVQSSSKNDVEIKTDDCDSNTILGKVRCKALWAYYNVQYTKNKTIAAWF